MTRFMILSGMSTIERHPARDRLIDRSKWRAAYRRGGNQILVDVEEFHERLQRPRELPQPRRHRWLDQVVALLVAVALLVVALRLIALLVVELLVVVLHALDAAARRRREPGQVERPQVAAHDVVAQRRKRGELPLALDPVVPAFLASRVCLKRKASGSTSKAQASSSM